MRPGRPAICSDPVPPQSLVDHAAEVGADLWLLPARLQLLRRQPAMVLRRARPAPQQPGLPGLRGANQLLNACGVLAALEAVQGALPVGAQAVRNGFSLVDLPGPLPGPARQAGRDPRRRTQPTCGRAAGAQSRQHGLLPRDLRGVRHAGGQGHRRRHRSHEEGGRSLDLLLAAGPPRQQRRGPGRSPSRSRCRRSQADPRAGMDSSVVCVATPGEGLALARSRAGENDRILVFGSFLTVAGALSAIGHPEQPGTRPFREQPLMSRQQSRSSGDGAIDPSLVQKKRARHRLVGAICLCLIAAVSRAARPGIRTTSAGAGPADRTGGAGSPRRASSGSKQRCGTLAPPGPATAQSTVKTVIPPTAANDTTTGATRPDSSPRSSRR